MDPTTLLTYAVSIIPEPWRQYVGYGYVAVSGILLAATWLRRSIRPPEPGSKLAPFYRVLTILSGASKWAAPIYDIGMTAVRTTREHAPALKVAAKENGIPVLSPCGKPVPPASSAVVSSPKPDN